MLARSEGTVSMVNNFLTFLKKYVWFITTIVAVGGLFLSIYQAKISSKSPALKYYVVKISPEAHDSDLQDARIKIEETLFQRVNYLVGQNSSLTYSEALDSVLPITESVGDLSGGVVVVIQNRGQITAKNLRVNINSETPIEKYQIFSNETSTLIEFDEGNGVLKFNVDRLTPNDKIQIALLFPGAYAVSLTASRANYVLQQPTPASQIAVIATKTALSQENIGNSLNGFLQFYTESKLDSIQTNVFVSSDEVQGEIDSTPADTSYENSLFFSTFQQENGQTSH